MKRTNIRLGINCPACGKCGTRCIDSRPHNDGASFKRRRVCSQCGGRFTTIEITRDLFDALTFAPRVAPKVRAALLHALEQLGSAA